ncbi:MAG: fibronectin type protein [Nocardioides sp.]|nr:fibronectin type protein [Nocardioides sp.]
MFLTRPALAALLAFGTAAAGLTTAPAAVAAPDTTAPKIESFDFTPDRIDLSTGAKSVTVTARITDESGLDSNDPFMIISSETTSQTQGFGRMDRVSGSATDGVYSRTVTMPDSVAPGTWSVRLYPLTDTVGNSNFFTDAAKKLQVRYGDSVPAAPTGVQATAGDAAATVSWTAPSSDQPITGYTVTSSPAGASSTVSGGATSAEVTGLTNGTAYTFTVAATNSVGTSPASSPSNQVTPSGLPSAPTNITAQRGDRSARLAWSPPADDGGASPKSYLITVLPGGRTVTAAAPATGATVTDLTNGATYTFTVATTNARGTSGASEPSNAITPAGAPLRMAALTAAVKKSTITLRWTAADGNGAPITGYVVSWKSKSKKVAATATSLVLRKMKAGRYRFTVRATNEVGSSEPSPARIVRVR